MTPDSPPRQKRELVIYGAGGFAREVHQLVTDLVADGAPIEFVGFLNDDPDAHGTALADFPVLGGASFLASHPGRFDVALAVGAPALKRRLLRLAEPYARAFPPLIHPTVVRPARLEGGRGFIACAASVFTVDVSVGNFVTVNLACTVGHDVVLSDFVTVAPGTNISGNVRLGEGCDVGTGAKVIQGRSIGAWSVVGAGAVVTTDLPNDCTAVGIPARPIKQREPGWQDRSH